MVEYEVLFLFLILNRSRGREERKGDPEQGKIQVSHKYVGSHPVFFIKVHLFVRGRIESMPLNLEIMSNVLQ